MRSCQRFTTKNPFESTGARSLALNRTRDSRFKAWAQVSGDSAELTCWQLAGESRGRSFDCRRCGKRSVTSWKVRRRWYFNRGVFSFPQLLGWIAL